MSDLARSAEFVPGYSSFLFNQLLQTQFYSVNRGGLSISRNLTDDKQIQYATNLPINNNVISLTSIIATEQTNTLTHSFSSVSKSLPQTTITNVDKSNNNVENVQANNNSVNNGNYESQLFHDTITKQRDQYNKQFEVHIKYTPMYPEINLLEFFGERELVKKNKKRLESLLYAPHCNIDILKLYSQKYVPHELRPMIWQLVFGYLPADRSKRETVLLSKQKQYTEMSNRAAETKDEELLNQIDMDVIRTLPEGHEVLFGNAAVKAALSRVLLVWALHHPATGYFQGLNDLASPFFYCFLSSHSTLQVGTHQFFGDVGDDDDNAEMEWEDTTLSQPDPETGIVPGLLLRVQADVYWCLCALLDSVEHLNAGSACGVHGETMMAQLETLMRVVDPPLDEHMKNQTLEYVHFAFPWMLCLLVREVPLVRVLEVWDAMACTLSYSTPQLEAFPSPILTQIQSARTSSTRSSRFKKPPSHAQNPCVRNAAQNPCVAQMGFAHKHVFVCAALLVRLRHEILSSEFPEMLQLLHRPPTKSWTPKDIYALLDHANMLYNSVHGV